VMHIIEVNGKTELGKTFQKFLNKDEKKNHYWFNPNKSIRKSK